MAKESDKKTIPERYEAESRALEGAVGGGPVRDVSGLLEVIEAEVKVVRSGAFFIQIILNPWAHLDRPPSVHMVNVDVARRLSKDAPEPLNEAEGRYILEIEPDWNWRDDPNLIKFWNQCVIPVINHTELHRRLTFRSRPKSAGAYGLFFPSGVAELATKLEKHANEQGWKLINREEAAIIEKNRRAKAEAERVVQETRAEEYRLEVEKAEDSDTLGEIRTRVEVDETISEESRSTLVQRIQNRIPEFESDRIDYDKLAKEIDPTRGFSRRRGLRVRRFGEVEDE
jgi:hypothetical protein